MNNYEIEIKTLLGSKDNADTLVEKMRANDEDLVTHDTHSQLNHYFVPKNAEAQKDALESLYNNAEHLIDSIEEKEKFKKITNDATKFSVRTRDADGKVILVIKASIDDTTSENGTARLEFEQAVDISLDELDKLVLESGFEYQAKWSRERTEYVYKGANVAIDKNAGYGYLAEFERVISDATKADDTKTELREMMSKLGVEELAQDRLQRMFEHYNNNWQDYYGTEKIFNIE